MDDDVKEITLYLLQQEYFKKNNIDLSEENMFEIIKCFPEDWEIMYSLDEKIKVLSYALKNNIKLEDSLDILKSNQNNI